MRILATPESTEFILAEGGQLYVWVEPQRCCGGPAFLGASTHRPPRLRRGVPTTFNRVEGAAFDLYLAHGNLAAPDELHIELRGRRRPRIVTFWNGAAYVGLV